MSKQIRWRPLFAEGAMIVLSILLAFGIEAWWQAEGERELEAVALIGLEQDFAAHGRRLSEHRDFFEARLEAAERLLAAMGPNASGADLDLTTTIGRVGFISEVGFQGGTLETLVAGAGLGVIGDPGLRALLSAWRQELEELREVNAFMSEEGRRYLDYLSERASLQDLDRSTGDVDVPASGFETDLRPLLRDLQFANVAYQQWYITHAMLQSVKGLEELADAVVTEIEALRRR